MARSRSSSTAKIADEAPSNYGSNQTVTLPTVGDFEMAMAAAGFGKFNWLFLLISSFGAIANIFEQATIAFVLPAAECDLALTLPQKGILGAGASIGTIAGCFIFGFISDTQGRRKTVIWGFFINTICVLGQSTSQTFLQLLIFKIMSGFAVCGPLVILIPYVMEMQSSEYRSRVLIVIGIMYSAAGLLLPTIALLVLPQDWNFYVFGLAVHSWQIFIILCGIPGFICGCGYLFFPESPKYLMSKQLYGEAMEAFQKMFAMNRGLPKESFPIKELREESSEGDYSSADRDMDQKEGFCSGMRKGLRQMRPLFVKPYLRLSLQVYTIMLMLAAGLNGLRMWVPQFFVTIEEMQTTRPEEDITMCNVIEYIATKNTTDTTIVNGEQSDCIVAASATSLGKNLISSCAILVSLMITGVLVKPLGRKPILLFTLFGCTAMTVVLYYAASSVAITIITTVFLSLGTVASISVQGDQVELFPTSCRSMVVALSQLTGCIGSIIFSLQFPYLLSLGCYQPHLSLLIPLLVASVLAIPLPDASKLALK